MSSAERRKLLTRAQGMTARHLIGKAGLSEAVLGQIRSLLAGAEIIKLRLPKDRDEAAGLVGRIAAEAPCELVGRVGFTAVFRAAAAAEQSNSGAGEQESP